VQSSRRVSRFAVLSVLIGAPLLSAAIFGSIAIAIAAALGAPHTFGIAALVAVTVVVVNSIALCMALALGESGARIVAEPAKDARGEANHAQAS
jgi:hypothetical protein